VIPAVGSGKLTATVRTNPLTTGRVTKSVAVLTDAPGEEYLRLTLTFQAVAALTVVPTPRVNLGAFEGEATTVQIALRRTDGKPLEVTGVEHDLPFDLAITTGRVSSVTDMGAGQQAEPGDVWIDVSLPPQPEATRGRGKLTVLTNHPDAPKLEVSARVSVRPLIDVRPRSVKLTISDRPDQRRDASVRLTHAGRVPFSVTKIEVSDPNLFTAALTTKPRQRYQVVRLALPDGLDSESLKASVQGTVRLHTTEGRKPVVEIPVTVSRGSASRGSPRPRPTRTVTR
jgi:hypothetical protein